MLPSSLANRKESEYITEMPQGEASFVPNYGKKCFPERSGSKIGDLLKRHDKFLNDYPIYEKNLKKSLNVLEGEKIYANLKAGDDSNKKNKAQLGLDLKQQLAVEGKQR